MFYAKSDNQETLFEHTHKLLDNLKLLKKLYGSKIDKVVPDNIEKDVFWKFIYWAAFFHDFGKAFTPFQNVIRKRIGEKEIDTPFRNDIPHGYLSPAFLPFDEIMDSCNGDERLVRILVQAIAFHHERDVVPDTRYIFSVIDNDLQPKLDMINKHMGTNIKKLDRYYVSDIRLENRITQSDSYYSFYILLKGLLHRLDHASSAHTCVEEESQESLDVATEKYIKDVIRGNVREVQNYAHNNADKNLIIVASTGIGKTEAALMWASNDKAFFTLPLRVTLNSLYSRVKDEIRFNKVGLLHSTGFDYLADKGYEDALEIYEHSRQLANRLSFTTVDQIFPFVFKYKGYEKVYATLAYSKIIVDEIQAYSPSMAASILKGLEMIYAAKGSFMVMTATLPRIYKEHLKQKDIPFEERQFLSPIKRHMVEIKEKPILDDVDEIINKAQNKKVLVLANTVARASEIYTKIKNRALQVGQNNVNLLHSLFIQEDRAKKEAKIQTFAKSSGCGIWVSTQIVEASLDVDFDYLFTEMSTLDSLFQRFGRCYRKRPFDLKHSNIYIYIQDVSGVGSIYDKDIWKFSVDYLKNYNDCIISEEDKVEMVDKLYSGEQLQGTKFLNDFTESLSFLETIIDYDLKKNEVQKLFRDMDTVKAVPISIYDKNRELFDACAKEQDRAKLMELYRTVDRLTLDVPFYKAKGHILERLTGERLGNMCILECKYSEEEGAVFEKKNGDFDEYFI